MGGHSDRVTVIGLWEFSENGFICFLTMHGRGFLGFVLIAIRKMETLATFPHLQYDIKMSRRYEGWYYPKWILYLETDWSATHPLPSTTLKWIWLWCIIQLCLILNSLLTLLSVTLSDIKEWQLLTKSDIPTCQTITTGYINDRRRDVSCLAGRDWPKNGGLLFNKKTQELRMLWTALASTRYACHIIRLILADWYS